MPPGPAPGLDHGGEQLSVLDAPGRVRFALVPDSPADPVGDERRNHGVVQKRRYLWLFALLGPDRIPLGVELEGGPEQPGAGQRNGSLLAYVLESELHGRSVSAESSAEPVVNDADRDRVLPRPDQCAWNRVFARRHVPARRASGDSADLFAVEIGDVEIVDGAQGQSQVLAPPSFRDVHIPAVPDHTVDAGQDGSALGHVRFSPCGQIRFRIGPAPRKLPVLLEHAVPESFPLGHLLLDFLLAGTRTVLEGLQRID